MAGWKPELSRSFNIALCGHLGLKHVVDLRVNTDADEIFSATITVALTADDIAAVGERMGGKVSEGEQEQASVHFDPPATDADLARFASSPKA